MFQLKTFDLQEIFSFKNSFKKTIHEFLKLE
jgi:hypothetical protein